MKESINFGMNKTGIQMSPRLTAAMLEGREEFQAPALDVSMSAARLKEESITESHPLGTVPLPGTAKGAFKAGLDKIRNARPEVLIDKLGERLAFERGGVRLYEALIVKCEAIMPDQSFDLLYDFREEEAQHFRMIWSVMESLGADPTAQTPCADASGVAAFGLLQVLNDPRTTVAQCVQAILIAERADNDGWELLIRLAEEGGLRDEVVKFTEAKVTEENHVSHMKHWLERLLLANESVPLQ